MSTLPSLEQDSGFEIKNKGFLLLNSMFKEHGWNLIKNEMDWICFSKPGFETEFF